MRAQHRPVRLAYLTALPGPDVVALARERCFLLPLFLSSHIPNTTSSTASNANTATMPYKSVHTQLRGRGCSPVAVRTGLPMARSEALTRTNKISTNVG